MDILAWLSAAIVALFIVWLATSLTRSFVNPIGWLELRFGGPLALVIFLVVSVLVIGVLLAFSVSLRG